MWLFSTSGGTDVCTAFVAGCPLLPVYEGELQCRALGCAVEAWDEQGNSLIDEVGELVITEPMPSMPLFLWGDEDGERLRESYFAMYPGIWRHGDWIRITPRGGAVIYGRSDSTINRQGVRMGTSEIYRAAAAVPQVLDALVVDVPREATDELCDDPVRGAARGRRRSTSELAATIKRRIREDCSPRHVPNEIRQIEEVPRTLSGKVLEVPVKRILMGAPPQQAASVDSLANPRSLDYFVELAKELAAEPASSPAGAERARTRSRRGRQRSREAAGRRRLQPHRAADDLLHDLVGAAVDARHARVGVRARDRVLEHVAVAAVQLQAAVDDAALQLGAPPLRDRGVLGRELAGVERLRAAVDEDARDLDLAAQLGEREARALEGADRLAEGLALAHVVERPAERRLARRRRAEAAIDEALLRQVGDEVAEALALLAEQVRGGHAHVANDSSAVSCACWPIFSRLRPRSKPSMPRSTHQQADAAVALARVGLHGDDHEVGVDAVGDERLGAVDARSGRRRGSRVVDIAARSEPMPGSVIAIAVISSPEAIPGSQRSRCSSSQ